MKKNWAREQKIEPSKHLKVGDVIYHINAETFEVMESKILNVEELKDNNVVYAYKYILSEDRYICHSINDEFPACCFPTRDDALQSALKRAKKKLDSALSNFQRVYDLTKAI